MFPARLASFVLIGHFSFSMESGARVSFSPVDSWQVTRPGFNSFMDSETSSKVSPMWAVLALRKHMRINIPRLQLHPLFPIPPSILPLHPGPEDQSDDYTSSRRTSRGNEGGNILWCVLHPKSASRKDAGEIAETDKDPGRGGARVLGEVVVVVPRMHEAGGDVSAEARRKHAR